MKATNRLPNIGQAAHIKTVHSLLKPFYDDFTRWGEDVEFGYRDDIGIFVSLGTSCGDFIITVKKSITSEELYDGDGLSAGVQTKEVYRFHLSLMPGYIQPLSLGIFEQKALSDFLLTVISSNDTKRGDLPPRPFEVEDYVLFSELTGTDFLGFSKGDRVWYMPDGVTDKKDPECSKGVVTQVMGVGKNQCVWVKYDSRDDSHITPIKNLKRVKTRRR